jgi:hypothetical protein
VTGIGVRFVAGERDFSLLHNVYIEVGSSSSALYNEYGGGIFSGVKQQGREADHSTSCNAEFKNDGAMPALPHTSSWSGV